MIQETGAQVTSQHLPEVMCDRSQIRQLLQNLVSNALKYRHPGRAPAIEVRVGAVPGITVQSWARAAGPGEFERTGTGHRKLVRIEIADNGIGFEDKFSEQIFEPFQRLHGPDEYEGTGIGLAICRKIVQRHGGTITAASRMGEGSTFIFTLPLRSPES